MKELNEEIKNNGDKELKMEIHSKPQIIIVYAQLFDSFLNVLTSASSLILRQIFDEIILPNFF